jgi:ribosome-binding ATPase YchF (GTP1/OBG family)
MLIGIVGKPSSGKSTFLNAACLTNAKTGNYPFTTIEPNPGSGSVKIECVCKELNVNDNPKNSVCIDGIRYIPVKLLDVAGLVPDAHLGKGLGNKFLSDLSRADVLLHIVDISGELDQEGREIEGRTHDPMKDIKFLEKEIDLWFKDILLRKDWAKFTNKLSMEKQNFSDSLYDRLSGLSIKKGHIIKSLKKTGLDSKKPGKWSNDDIELFASSLRKISKPILIVANKIDKKKSEENYNKLKTELKENLIPASALSEVFIRNLAEKGIIQYFPGDSNFEIINRDDLKPKENDVLLNIKEKILKKYNNTGIQEALNQAVFGVLKNIVVFPVRDEKNYTDNDGNVLPDAFVVPLDMNLLEFVKDKIHSDLAKNFIYAVDARTKMRLGESHKLKNKDIIKIVSAGK